MDIRTVKIDTLKNWERNPREAIDVERLKEVLEKRGQLMPLLLDGRDMSTILGGNMRLKAMRGLGWTECVVSVVIPKDEKDAVEIALEDNDNFGKYVQTQLIELVKEFDIDTRINIDINPVKIEDIMLSDTDYSEKNKEIDIDNFDDKYKVTLNFNEEEYERFLSLIAVAEEKLGCKSNEQTLLKLLEDA